MSPREPLKPNFVSSSELLKMYPELKKWNWTPRSIAAMVKSMILNGHWDPVTRKCMIDLESLPGAIELVNRRLENLKVKVDIKLD